MSVLRNTLELVERELARSEAFLQGTREEPAYPAVEVDRQRREELVHELLYERRERLAKRLTEPSYAWDDARADPEPRRARADPEPRRARADPEPRRARADPEPRRKGPRPAPRENSPSLEAEELAPRARQRRATPSRQQRPARETPEKRPASGKRPASSGPAAEKRPVPSRASASPARWPKPHSKQEQWVARYMATQRHRQVQREQAEVAELATCTFKPQLNARSIALAQRARVAPLVERLHHEADARDRLRAKAKALLDEQEVAQHPFQPCIKPTALTQHQRPLHERANEIVQRTREAVNMKRTQQELANKDLTFCPQLDARSEHLVQRLRERAVYSGGSTVLGPVEDRLLAAKKAPPPSEESERDEGDAAVVSSFLQRQEQFLHQREQHLMQKQREQEAVCTFHPKIAAHSEVLVESSPQYLGETPQERIARLAVQDPQRREQRREELGKQAFAGCSFQPNVERSRRPVEDVHERLHKTGTVAASRVEVDPGADPECTFAPVVKLPEKLKHVKGHYDFANPDLCGAITEELRERAHRRQEDKQTVEAERLAECTFRPARGEEVAPASRPVIVRGLDRFLELRELARKKNEAKEPKPRSVAPGHVTIPEPFSLSSSSRPARREPPPRFHPATVESSRREMVEELLRSYGVADVCREYDDAARGFSAEREASPS